MAEMESLDTQLATELPGAPATSYQEYKESTQKSKKKQEGIAFSKPTLSKKELKSVLECMVQDEISFGRVVLQMEKEFASAFEFRKALTAPSLTSAFHLALLSLNLKEGDQVILPANASVAVLDALGYVKAEPVLIDLDRHSFHPAIDSFKEKLNEKTRAIVLNYPYGAFQDYEPLREWLQTEEAQQKAGSADAIKELKIIEDISYNAGTEHMGRYVGTDADIAIIGLHADMLMTTGKGAVLLTDSKNLFAAMKDLRYHGGDKPYRLRYDYTITDYQAAMGIEQLGNLAQILERRRTIGEKFMAAISNSKLHTYLRNIKVDSFGAFPVIAETSLDHSLHYFNSLKIEVKRTNEYGPLHDLMGLPSSEFPNTEKLYQRGLLLPLYPYLTKMNVERLVGAIKAFY